MAKKQKHIEHIKPTRRQVSRKEREHKTNRIIMIAGAIILVLAIVLAGYGYFDSQYRPFHQTVLEVNDTKVDMEYYLTMLKVYLKGQDPSQASFLAGMVMSTIENNLILIQGAPEIGYTVNPKEIDDAISASKLPNQQVFRDMYSAEVLRDKMSEEYFGKDVPTSAEQVKVQALVFEGEKIAQEAIEKNKSGETFTILAQTYGVEQLTKEKGGELGWLPKGMIADVLGIANADVLENTAFNLQPGEISQPIYDKDVTKGTGYWILKIEEKDGDVGRHVRAILVGTPEEATEVKNKLDTGADFATLAKEVSQDKSKDDGGDLGWFTKGAGDNPLVTEAAFMMDAGQTSEPIHDVAIETKGGYWVIRVVEKESNRPLDETFRNSMIDTNLQQWLNKQGQASKVKELLTEEQKTWAVSRVLKEIESKQT